MPDQKPKPPRRRARPLLLAGLTLAASLALGACGDDEPGGNPIDSGPIDSGNVFPDSGPDSGNPFPPDSGTD